MTQTTSVPDPFTELARASSMLRARSPEHFDWFIKQFVDIRTGYLEVMAKSDAGDLLGVQGHVRCMARLLDVMTTAAPPPAPPQ